MSQTLPTGKTLQAEILDRLSAYTYPPDVAKARADLASIRNLVTKTARFSASQKQAITNALASFDPLRNIRFRSSSNAEDAQTFSAAGLYDSFSGCLADDLDPDDSGPCLCDPAEPNEHGAFRAIQKVYASFYNDNAFLERLRVGIDERQVGMAVLVHYSNPDEEEMANGVAKLTKQTTTFTQLKAELVTQLGAVSVTNPQGNAKPETAVIYESGSPVLTQPSSLVPLGSCVMNWEQDYDVFANHRLKCHLTLQTANLRLDPTNLAQCFYTDATFDYHDGLTRNTLTGAPASWPNAAHRVTQDPRRGTVITNAWTTGAGSNQLAFQLTSVIPTADSSQTPFLVQAEIRKWLKVTYATPRPILDWQSLGTNTLSEEVQLVAAPDLSTLQPGNPEVFSTTNGIRFDLSFLSSTNASSLVLGIDPNFWGTLPAALSPWLNTRITGLTPQPLELTGYWSQSAKAGHKYRYATYLFEPALESGLPAGQLQALRDRNIAWIWVERETWPGGAAHVVALGFDGKFRPL